MKKNKRLNAFLAIELFSGECFFEAHTRMKSDTVALAIHNVFASLRKSGAEKVTIYMDQNPTHKTQMLLNLALLLVPGLVYEVRYLPAYSPNYNIVEFLIHRIRQSKLHHAPHQRNLEEIEKELSQFLNNKKPFPQEQIYNTLQHIRTQKQTKS
jgi:hypothetical protein